MDGRTLGNSAGGDRTSCRNHEPAAAAAEPRPPATASLPLADRLRLLGCQPTNRGGDYLTAQARQIIPTREKPSGRVRWVCLLYWPQGVPPARPAEGRRALPPLLWAPKSRGAKRFTVLVSGHSLDPSRSLDLSLHPRASPNESEARLFSPHWRLSFSALVVYSALYDCRKGCPSALSPSTRPPRQPRAALNAAAEWADAHAAHFFLPDASVARQDARRRA
jgi:hypothetical protein